jgi:hypothetical protein
MAKSDKPNKGGRPTKYKPEYCEEIIRCFNQRPTRKRAGKTEANPPPLFIRFAIKIGVHYDTLQEWRKQHIEFSEAYKKAKKIQEAIMIEGAISGHYAPAFAIFAMKNMHAWRDKREHIVEADDLNLTINLKGKDG